MNYILKEDQPFHGDRYRILQYVSRGGYGEVWRARRNSDQRVVAIKLLSRAALADDTATRRFKLEFEILSKLSHPGLMKVHEYDFHPYQGVQLPWFSMDYYPQNFHKRAQQIESAGEKIRILLPVLEALDYAHARNVVHRDLKPQNILVDDDDRAVLTDFGIAKEMDVQRNLTGVAPIGTPPFMSPEQCTAQPLTSASDIYTMGVILYHICVGRYPFEGTSHMAVISAHIGTAPTPVRHLESSVSPQLEEIIMRCLAKAPEDRFETAAALRRALIETPELNEASAEKRVFRREDVAESERHSYRILGLIAQGGYAEVYRARRMGDGRPCALKILRPILSEDDEARKRFRREIQILERLDHPNIVGVTDRGARRHGSSELPFFVMDYFPGNLLEAMKEPVDLEKAMPVILDVLRALHFAHGAAGGVLHRDLKPANILIDSEGRGHLADFGIAKVSSADWGSQTQGPVTRRGALGTSPYMSPEQFSPERLNGEPLDGRSDLYAMGVILYELVCSRRPFEATSDVAMGLKHLNEKPVPPRTLSEAVPPRIESIVLRLLEKDRERRFSDAKELIAAIEAARARDGWFGSGGATGDFRSALRTLGRHARTRRPYVAAAVALLAFGATSVVGHAVSERARARRLSLGVAERRERETALRAAAFARLVDPATRTSAELLAPEDRARVEAARRAAETARAAGDWPAAFARAAEERAIVAAAIDRGRFPELVSPDAATSTPAFLAGRPAAPLRFRIDRASPEVVSKFERVARVLARADDGSPGAEVAGAAVSFATAGDLERVEIAGLAPGRYLLRATAAYGSGDARVELKPAERLFDVIGADDWIVQRAGLEPRWTLEDPKSRASDMTWSLRARSGAKPAEFEIASARGSNSLSLGPKDLPADLPEGLYDVICRVKDRESGEEIPLEASSDPFVVDRTPPKLIATLGGEPIPEGGVVLLPGRSAEILLAGEDEWSSNFDFVQDGRRLSSSPEPSRVASLEWSRPARGELASARTTFRVEHPGADGEPLSDAREIVVWSLADATPFETWAELEKRIAAAPERYARTLALAPVEPGLLAALASPDALELRLAAMIAPGEGLPQVLDRLLSRDREKPGLAARRLALAEQDDAFAARAEALARLLEAVPQDSYGDRPKAEIAASLEAARAAWVAAPAGATPDALLAPAAGMVIPPPPASPEAILEVRREGSESGVVVRPGPGASAARGLAFRYALSLAGDAPEPLANAAATSPGPLPDSTRELADELLSVAKAEPRGQEHSPRLRYAELGESRLLVYQYVLESPDGATIAGAPGVWRVEPLVDLTDADRARMRAFAGLLDLIAKMDAKDLRSVRLEGFPASLPLAQGGTLGVEELRKDRDEKIEAAWRWYLGESEDARAAFQDAVEAARPIVRPFALGGIVDDVLKKGLAGVVLARRADARLRESLREAIASDPASDDDATATALLEKALDRFLKSDEGPLLEAPGAPRFPDPTVARGRAAKLPAARASELEPPGPRMRLQFGWTANDTASPTDKAWTEAKPDAGDGEWTFAPPPAALFESVARDGGDRVFLALRFVAEARGARPVSETVFVEFEIAEPTPIPTERTPEPELTPSPAPRPATTTSPGAGTAGPAPDGASDAGASSGSSGDSVSSSEALALFSRALPRKGGGYRSNIDKAFDRILELYESKPASVKDAAKVSDFLKQFADSRVGTTAAVALDTGDLQFAAPQPVEDLGGGRIVLLVRHRQGREISGGSFEFHFVRAPDGGIAIRRDTARPAP